MSETGRKTKKIYYSMGEVSEMFDVNPSLIRFWEQKFSILKPEKNKKGNRLFTQQDVDNLKLIYHLVKENGMTLAGAQKRLKENREGLERNLEIIERLQTIKTLLLEVRQELKEADVRANEIRVDDEPESDWAVGDDALASADAAETEVVSVPAVVGDQPAETERMEVSATGKERPDEALETLSQSAELLGESLGAGQHVSAEEGTGASTESDSEPKRFIPQEQPLFPEYVTPQSVPSDVQSEALDERSASSDEVSNGDREAQVEASEEAVPTGRRMQIIEQTLF